MDSASASVRKATTYWRPYPLELDDTLLGHLVLVPKPAHKEQGDFGIEQGRLINSDAPEFTFSGVAIYRPAFFADCVPGRFPLARLLRRAADAGQLGASVYEGLWEDVGTPDRLAELNQ